jgi:hypothetical protein
LGKYRENNSCRTAVKISRNHYGYNEENQLLTVPYYDVSFWLDEMTETEIQPGM